MAMLTVATVALIAFRAPWQTLAVGNGKGVWDALHHSGAELGLRVVLEGIAGFAAPVAVVVPLLIAICVKPV